MPRTDTHPNLDLASAATGPGRPRVRRLPYRSGCHTAAIFTPPSPPRRLELRSIKRRGGGGSTPPCAMAAAGCGAGSSLYLRERAGCKRVGLGWGAGSRSGFAREESPSRGFGAAAGHDTSEAAAAGGCGWWARQRAGGGAASAAGGGDGGGDGGGGGGGGGDGVAAPGGSSGGDSGDRCEGGGGARRGGGGGARCEGGGGARRESGGGARREGGGGARRGGGGGAARLDCHAACVMRYSSTARRSTSCLDVKGPYTRASLPPLGCSLP